MDVTPKKQTKLLSVRQVAQALGKARHTILRWCLSGRIPEAQLVDGKLWVVPEDFTVLKSGLESDPLLRGLPSEFTSIDVDKKMEQIDTYEVYVNPTPSGHNRFLDVKGYERIKNEKNLSKWAIYRLTGVHPATQKKMERGEKVAASVVVRLSLGLEVEIEDLLT